MTKAAQEFLRSFKALPPTDQHDVLVQLLREPIEATYEAPSGIELTGTAEMVFLEYDKDEQAS